MRTQIAKWGNSLGVRIPKAQAQEAGLAEGVAVDVKVSGRTLLIAPSEPRYALEDLVGRITSRNRHAESDWGAPMGREVW